MIGFLGCISIDKGLQTVEYDYFGNKPYLEDEYHCGPFHLRRKLNPKFSNDKLFEDDEQLFIGVDGVLLNALQLRNNYGVKNNFELVKLLYNKYKEQFINELKGNFSLIIYDKVLRKTLVYTDLTTAKPIYYYYNKKNNEFYFGSNSLQLAQFLMHKKIELTENEFAFYSVASFGHLYSDEHFTNEIKKLRAGHFVSFSDTFSINQYFKFSTYPQNNLNITKSVKVADELFKEAVRLQFQKNEEYNYKQLANLSGGLDSRVTTYIGHELGFKNINTITFSSKGHWDGIIAKQISKEYKFKHQLIYIDSGNHLLEHEDSIFLTGGLLSFYFTNQALKFYDQIDFSDFGLMHTGHLGNATLASTFHNYPNHFKYNYPNPHYKNYYADFLEEKIVNEMSSYESSELANFYNRGFNFTQEGNQFNYPYSECNAPFTDKEFMQFCLKTPLKYRNNYKFYLQWIGKFYPKLGKFYYDKTGRRTLNISKKKLRKIHHYIYINYLRSIGLKDKNNELLNFEKWRFKDNLEEKLDFTFNETISIVKNNNLRENLQNQYKSNSFQVKLKALHAVLTYKLYFG